MISSKFPKSFRVDRDLEVFYDFCSDFRGIFSDFAKFTKLQASQVGKASSYDRLLIAECIDGKYGVKRGLVYASQTTASLQ